LAAATVARTLRASADALKLDTDKTSQEHNTASRDLAQHVQTFGEFMEMQKKNRAKVPCNNSLRQSY